MDVVLRCCVVFRDVFVFSVRIEVMKKFILEVDSFLVCLLVGFLFFLLVIFDVGYGSYIFVMFMQDCSDQVCNMFRKFNVLVGGGVEIYEFLLVFGMGFFKFFKFVVDVSINRIKIVVNCCICDIVVDMFVDFEMFFQIYFLVLDVMLQVLLFNLKLIEDGIFIVYFFVVICYVIVCMFWKKRVNDMFCIYCNLELKMVIFMVEVFSGVSFGVVVIFMLGFVMKVVRIGQKDIKVFRELCFQYKWQLFV